LTTNEVFVTVVGCDEQRFIEDCSLISKSYSSASPPKNAL
jgi:hypothetical protein